MQNYPVGKESKYAIQGQIQDFWKGGSYVKGGRGFSFADLISFFLHIP